jgi:hypothetical protein
MNLSKLSFNYIVPKPRAGTGFAGFERAKY